MTRIVAVATRTLSWMLQPSRARKAEYYGPSKVNADSCGGMMMSHLERDDQLDSEIFARDACIFVAPLDPDVVLHLEPPVPA